MGKTYTFSNVNFAYFTTILYASKKEMKPPPFQFNFVNLKMFAARKMTTVIGRRMNAALQAYSPNFSTEFF